MYRYIGNKTKLLEEILVKVNEMIGDSGTVADLMAGTGAVSLALREKGYNVIASDSMTYSYHHLRVNLLLKEAPLFLGIIDEVEKSKDYEISSFLEYDNYTNVLRYLNNLEPIEGFFHKEFSPGGNPTSTESDPRKYFTSENAMKIDAIRNKLNEWIADKRVSDIEESLLKHTLILAVNRFANISGTYGYFLAKFRKNALKPFELFPVEIYPYENINHVVMQDFAEIASKNVTADLLYLDPPYMKRQYAANYHILETIARGDFPDAIGKSGLRDWWDQHSSFCTKTKGLLAFDEVISNVNADKILISYSEDGLFTLEQLVESFSKHGKVSVDTIEHLRFKSNNSKLPNKITEYLISIDKNWR